MNQKRVLTASTIALINVCAVCNIKNFPLLAEYGLSILLFLALSALFFFIPVSLVSAELASAWPERGVYTWVKEGLGPKLGFLAIWLQWIENVVWYPTILSFIAATFAYLFNPALATQTSYLLPTIVIAFWVATLINFLGMRVSGWISSLSALFGTLIPIALIILLGIGWLLAGHPSEISWSWGALLPDLTSLNELVLLSGVLFGLAGMEMSAVHAKDVAHPRRDYPRAILLSALLILVFSALGALSIASVVPAEKIQLASGSMEAFQALFNAFGIPWATPLIAALMTFGALGMMSSWIVGPSRGLLASAQDGDLPRLFRRENRHGMPTAILVIQAGIVTFLSLIFLLMPSVNSSYWILLALASILYQIMYLLLFIAAIRLRYKRAHTDRPYQVPGGTKGMWVISLLGLIGSSFALLISFVPPSQIETGGLLVYESLLIGGALLFCLLPFGIYAWEKRR